MERQEGSVLNFEDGRLRVQFKEEVLDVWEPLLQTGYDGIPYVELMQAIRVMFDNGLEFVRSHPDQHDADDLFIDAVKEIPPSLRQWLVEEKGIEKQKAHEFVAALWESTPRQFKQPKFF